MKKLLLSLALMASALMGWALDVECTPGELANLVSDHSITSLKITGQMDARDFKFIADELEALTIVDLSGVTIVSYINTTNPLFNNEVRYPENCIPPMAFFGKKITQITLPESTRAIGMAAFAGCKDLESFTFPENLDSIAAYAFSAAKISRLYLPESVRVLGEGAFSNITSLATASIKPATEMAIPKSAFEGCTSVNTVTLGPNVTAIGDRAFKGTIRLYRLLFSDSNNIKSIGKEAFLGSKLADFNFEQANSLTTIGDWAFAESKQVSAAMATATSKVGRGAFYYAADLTSYIPSQQTDTISDMLLAGTAVTNDVTDSTATRYIGKYALYNTPIVSLTLPESLEYIDTKAMAGMIELDSLTSLATAVPELGENVWAGVKQAMIPLVVPEESYEAYSAADQWLHFLIQYNAHEHVFGDVDQDGVVTSTDITALYNYMLNNDMTFYETSDVDGDGAVTAGDISVVYNILLGNKNPIGRNKSVYDSNDKMDAQGFTIEAGHTHTVEVELVNTAAFSAMQLDIDMPQGLSITDVTATSRAEGMNMGFNEIEPGKWRILLYSATALKGNSGTLFNITVKADDSFGGNETIAVGNILAVEPSELKHFIGDFMVEVGNTTGVKDINIDSAGPVDVYNMNGQLLRHNVEPNEATQGLPSGIYIVGGKKVIVR
ncbi:MAG: leucine-rich repeat protein [Muribaculaceae bacterium]|nr:leucine-rich repeat protein [Muribaculaceae bacterium]MBR6489242.1 leucine-rich repeat protein [Muribaculaceae bacterium]